ncbi:MAG: riboflavin biosynthesis protein RibD, partial [Bacillota bacterium]|nr:riboflavin biosynthesis protein RibD [Bacillota bacterium]
MTTDVEKYMLRAIALAEKARGFTDPNPLVGAVIVKNDKIIGEGYHTKAGKAHAEVEA